MYVRRRPGASATLVELAVVIENAQQGLVVSDAGVNNGLDVVGVVLVTGAANQNPKVSAVDEQDLESG